MSLLLLRPDSAQLVLPQLPPHASATDEGRGHDEPALAVGWQPTGALGSLQPTAAAVQLSATVPAAPHEPAHRAGGAPSHRRVLEASACQLECSPNAWPAVRRTGDASNGYTTTWPGEYGVAFASDARVEWVSVVRTTPVDGTFSQYLTGPSNQTFVQAIKTDFLEVGDVRPPARPAPSRPLPRAGSVPRDAAACRAPRCDAHTPAAPADTRTHLALPPSAGRVVRRGGGGVGLGVHGGAARARGAGGGVAALPQARL